MRIVVVLLVAWLMPGIVAAQEVAFDRLPEQLNAGDHVRVVDTAGRTHSGAVAELTDDGLALARGGGAVERLTRHDVREVWVRRRDSVRTGALIGFASVAVPYCASAMSRHTAIQCGVPALFLGGLGAGLGALFDAAVIGHVRVFRAPPVALRVTPGRGGVSLDASLRW